MGLPQARVICTSVLPLDIRPILGETSYSEPTTGNLTRDELLACIGGAEGLITVLNFRIDSELLAAAPNLRVVANFAAGFDNIDLPAATRAGVVVTNTPDAVTDATADFTFALLLAAARRVVEGHDLASSGQWTGWEPTQLLGARVSGQTLGIIGFGRIGQAVARRATGFGMRVVYASRSQAGSELGERVALPELFARSDFVSLHCPMNPETDSIIDSAALALMKPTAFLINTARGGCVDEAALSVALRTGTIAGAACDVFRDEPHISKELAGCPRLLLAPHIGSATTKARTQMAEICAHAVRAVLTGNRPATVINSEVYE